MTHDTNANDPLSDFSIPQDADIVADDPGTGDGGESVADDTGDQADKVAENPAVDAGTPEEAEDLMQEPGA